MLSITAISAGAIDYLLRGSGCGGHDHTHEPGTAETDAGRERGSEPVGVEYLLGTGTGEPAAVWFGAGLAMVGIASGSVAREADVRAVFGQLRHPDSTEEESIYLGRPPRHFRPTEARIALALTGEPDADTERKEEIENTVRADGRKAVAYYDLTFSPVKSVSVYWAALMSEGRHSEAELVARAHREALGEAMGWAEREAAYTRVGYHGKTSQGRSVGRFEKATGLVWTRWDHSTNRNQEPQLHTHVAVLNRVVTESDGQIRALDGRGFAPIKRGVDAIYTAGYEARLSSWLGVVFAERPDGKAREIIGVDQRLLDAASTRHIDVVDRADQLEMAYERRHGRTPSPSVRKSLARAAVLATRAAKSTRTPGEQLRRWCAPRRSELREGLRQVAAAAARVARYGHPDQRNHRGRDVEQVLADAVTRTRAAYATWDVGNLVDCIVAELHRTPGVTQQRAEELATQVLANGARYGVVLLSAPDVGTVPAELQRADGKIRYRAHHDERYATVDQLACETGLVGLSRAPGAPALDHAALGRVRGECEAAGLGADQTAAVIQILSSGRTGDVLIGPAGAGKSHTMGVLAQQWRTRFGGRVFGVATSQIAALELEANGLEAFNTTVFTRTFTPDRTGQTEARPRAGDLVVIDEVGMSSTAELAAIVGLVAGAGGKVLYTGDQEQLASVEAGGMLNLLVADNGCVELTEVRRFDHRWEAEASLGLRAGDARVSQAYDRHGRLIAGTSEQMCEAATRAWLADTLSGKQSLLVTASNTHAAELSAGIRAELVRLGRVHPDALATGRDGNPIGIGDWIQARRNDPRIPVAHPDGVGESGGRVAASVVNRVAYQVLDQHPVTKTLRVRSRTGGIARLPAEYVAEHTTLAYAATVYAAQGRTVDTCHVLVDAGIDRRSVYVGMTRGRQANTAYIVSERPPDAHHPERLESTACARLREILDRADTPSTGPAELLRRAGEDEGRQLAWIGSVWDAVAADEARGRHTRLLTTLLPRGEAAILVGEPGYQRLLRAVRAAELAGHHPGTLIEEIVTERALIGADSMSDVLRWRLHRAADRRTPERAVVDGDWTALTTPVPGPVADYITLLAEAASARQSELGQHAVQTLPRWAIQRLGPPPLDEDQRRDWIRRAGIAAAYRDLRAIGDEQISIGPAPAREQVFHRALWHQAHTALGTTPGADTDEVDYATASDAQLRQVREAYRRALTWAPEYVHHELRDARVVAAGYAQDAVLWQAEADDLGSGSSERAAAEADVAAAQQLAARYHARAEHLQVIAGHRDQWHQDTEPLHARHVLAGDELRRRGLQPEPVAVPWEQAALFDLPDPDHGDRDRSQTREGTSRDRGRASDARRAADAVAAALAAARGELHDSFETDQATGRDQQQLFTTDVDPRDLASAQPLREPTPSAEHPAAAGEPLTVGHARRQAEISARLCAELAAERNRLISALQPVNDHLTDRDQTATASWDAHRHRDAAEPEHRWLARTLGHDITEEHSEEHADDLGLDL